MKTVTSISGGRTSAYLGANYHSDNMVFSLVRTSDKSVRFKDKKIAQIVADKIQTGFVGTLEDDAIIYTVLDLEQFLGRSIDWVTGVTFDQLIKNKSQYLPNIASRFCTTELKIRPIFHWWHDTIGEPIIMNIGFRANEKSRADKMILKTNKDGLSTFSATFEKHPSGRNKWKTIAWRKPEFPLVEGFVYSGDVQKFWKNKPVRFAKYNNCVGCFHRSAMFLNEMSKADETTFDWFVNQEESNKGFFKKNLSYKKIKKSNFTQKLDVESEGCGSGFCGF